MFLKQVLLYFKNYLTTAKKMISLLSAVTQILVPNTFDK